MDLEKLVAMLRSKARKSGTQTSHFRGVSLLKQTARWHAQINVGGKQVGKFSGRLLVPRNCECWLHLMMNWKGCLLWCIDANLETLKGRGGQWGQAYEIMAWYDMPKNGKVWVRGTSSISHRCPCLHVCVPILLARRTTAFFGQARMLLG